VVLHDSKHITSQLIDYLDVELSTSSVVQATLKHVDKARRKSLHSLRNYSRSWIEDEWKDWTEYITG